MLVFKNVKKKMFKKTTKGIQAYGMLLCTIFPPSRLLLAVNKHSYCIAEFCQHAPQLKEYFFGKQPQKIKKWRIYPPGHLSVVEKKSTNLDLHSIDGSTWHVEPSQPSVLSSNCMTLITICQDGAPSHQGAITRCFVSVCVWLSAVALMYLLQRLLLATNPHCKTTTTTTTT